MIFYTLRNAIDLKIDNETFLKALQDVNIFKKQAISTINYIWLQIDGQSKALVAVSESFHLKPQVITSNLIDFYFQIISSHTYFIAC